jgi:DNA mismatch repair protein MutH
MSCIALLNSGKRKGLICGRISCCYHKSMKKTIDMKKPEIMKTVTKHRLVRITTRPTIENVMLHYEQMQNTFTLPITKNKGNVGLFLEKQLGIPSSSATLDCLDGEIKCFPLRECGKVKESVAVTMMDKDFQETAIPFHESKLCQKLKKTLFIPYVRKEDKITFLPCLLFDEKHFLFPQLKNDYELLQTSPLSGRYGMYLQTRTKGPGHGSTSRAFYLRPSFLEKIIRMKLNM